jgi:excisionase family DNA binding protein
MSKITDIRFRLKIAGGNMRMIKQGVFEYFKKEPDVMQVKDVVRLLHCSKNTIYKLIKEGRIDSIKIGRNILIPKTALVEMMVNERYYQIISPLNPDLRWTSQKD